MLISFFNAAYLFRQRIELASRGFNPDQAPDTLPAAPANTVPASLPEAIDLTAEVDAPVSMAAAAGNRTAKKPTYDEAISFLASLRQRVPAMTYRRFIVLLNAYKRHGNVVRVHDELKHILGGDSTLFNEFKYFLPRDALETAQSRRPRAQQRSEVVTIDLAGPSDSSPTNTRKRAAASVVAQNKRAHKRAGNTQHAANPRRAEDESAEEFVPGVAVQVKWTDGEWYDGLVKRITKDGSVRIVYAETNDWHECEETVTKKELGQRLRRA
eukprot:SAG11_NODE_1105_length_5858_cov_3.050009_2_plen_269_part_00